MEQIVSEYEIPPVFTSFSWKKKVLLFPAVAGFALVFAWGIEALFHWDHRPFAYELIMAAAAAATIVFRPFRLFRLDQRTVLVLGDTFVEGRTKTGFFTVRKRIERSAITGIKETRRGLLVMDRSEFGARMLGFVFIPSRLPQYQQIRAELARWHSIESKLGVQHWPAG